jgi:hypothetical protein
MQIFNPLVMIVLMTLFIRYIRALHGLTERIPFSTNGHMSSSGRRPKHSDKTGYILPTIGHCCDTKTFAPLRLKTMDAESGATALSQSMISSTKRMVVSAPTCIPPHDELC